MMYSTTTSLACISKKSAPSTNPFSASASYIHDNEITETPFSPLYSGGSNPEMSGITVDDEGNIWVLNSTYERREIDEFAKQS